MAAKDNLSSIISVLERTMSTLQPYKDALSIMENNQSVLSLGKTISENLNLMDCALSQGIFDSTLAKSISGLLTPYRDFTGAQATIAALGESFSSLMKPEVYENLELFTASVPDCHIDVEGVAKALEPLTHATTLLDTSWVRWNNPWFVKKDLLTGLNIDALSGITGSFSKLCQLEKETSSLARTPDTMISVSSQIASIYEAIKPSIPLEDLIASTRLLDDYCALAIQQYEHIQRTTDHSAVEWRFEVLDAASKYVDRQTTWILGIADHLNDEDHTESAEKEFDHAEPSAVSLIPTHIGYTRSKNAQKTVSEGFEASSIVSITEKGKRITEGIIRINQLQLDGGNERIFGLSETVVAGMINIGTVVCTCNDHLGKIIDALYFIFYENLEHIKALIGDGDKEKGDLMVRKEDAYQSIFRIKTIRSDLRHDLDHGTPKDRKKKQLLVGDCYKLYCGNRPLREKDFKRLQEKLYDEMLALEEKLITYQVSNC